MAKALLTVRYGDARGFTYALSELVDEGILDASNVLDLLLYYLSESEVEEFVTRSIDLRDEDNEPIIRREEEEEEEEVEE